MLSDQTTSERPIRRHFARLTTCIATRVVSRVFNLLATFYHILGALVKDSRDGDFSVEAQKVMLRALKPVT